MEAFIAPTAIAKDTAARACAGFTLAVSAVSKKS